MAIRKSKGIKVEVPQGIKEQLKVLYDNLELTYDEVKSVMLEVVQAGADEIQSDINKVLDKHIKTGVTREHAIKPDAKLQAIGNMAVISANAGIEFSGNLQDMKHGDGGYAALLLDYGTPKKRVQKNPKRKYKHSIEEPVRPREITACIRRGRKRATEKMIKECDDILKERGLK